MTEERTDNWWTNKRVVALIFVIALLLRLSHAISMRSCPLYTHPIMDMAEHDNWAKSLAKGNWLGKGAFFRAPLYPYLLGVTYTVFGHSYVIPRLLQALLGALTCLLIYWLGYRYFDELTAKIAMAMAALYWPFIFFDGELLLTSLALFFNMLVLVSTTVAFERRGVFWLYSGFAFALAALTRPNILLFGLFLGFYLIFEAFKKERSWQEPLLLLLGTVLLIAPVTIRNYYVSNDFVLVAWQGGVNFYIGNNPHSDGHTAIVPGTRPDWQGGFIDTIAIARTEMGRKLAPSEISWFWLSKGLKFIVSEPLQWGKLLLRKLTLFVLAPEVPNNLSLYFYRQFSLSLSLPLLGYALVGPLGYSGILMMRKKWRDNALLLSYFLVYSSSIILFFVCARYRIQVVPILLLFAASFVSSALKSWHEKEWSAARYLFGVFLLCFVVINCAWFWYDGHLPEKDLASHITMGNAYVKTKSWALARQYYEKAVQLNLSEPGVFLDLALVCLRQGDKKSALYYSNEAARRDVGDRFGGKIARIRAASR